MGCGLLSLASLSPEVDNDPTGIDHVRVSSWNFVNSYELSTSSLVRGWSCSVGSLFSCRPWNVLVSPLPSHPDHLLLQEPGSILWSNFWIHTSEGRDHTVLLSPSVPHFLLQVHTEHLLCTGPVETGEWTPGLDLKADWPLTYEDLKCVMRRTHNSVSSATGSLGAEVECYIYLEVFRKDNGEFTRRQR